jgi:hypothetical protein
VLQYPAEQQPVLLAVVALYALCVILIGTILTIAFRIRFEVRP